MGFIEVRWNLAVDPFVGICAIEPLIGSASTCSFEIKDR